MTSIERQPAAEQPNPARFQYSLRTLLLVCVVLASSVAVFGAWGIVVFAIVVGLAIHLHHFESLWSLGCLVVVVLFLMCAGLLLSAVNSVHESDRRAQCAYNLYEITRALQLYFWLLSVTALLTYARRSRKRPSAPPPAE